MVESYNGPPDTAWEGNTTKRINERKNSSLEKVGSQELCIAKTLKHRVHIACVSKVHQTNSTKLDRCARVNTRHFSHSRHGSPPVSDKPKKDNIDSSSEQGRQVGERIDYLLLLA